MNKISCFHPYSHAFEISSNSVQFSFHSWENGENHLLFNIVPPENSDISELNTDRAIIAGADFDVWSFRTGFDYPIPFLGFKRDNSITVDTNDTR